VNDLMTNLAGLLDAVGVQFDTVSDGLWIQRSSYC
jgi:hypothetical protein